MTLLEMKKKVLGMIEELNPNSELLTDDPDIATKLNEVINQIMFELVRMKKLPKYVELEVNEGDIIEFADIEKKCGYEIYQIALVGGINCAYKAQGTVIKALESGTAEIDCYVYPERITEKTKDKAYEFELTADLLEILPYGVAGDLLKSDVSAEYGAVYSTRYESMLQRIDPRNQTGFITIEGGVKL
jgi:hypothetical protein